MFTKCDEDYGRRVREGLQKMKGKKQHDGIRTADEKQADDAAENVSKSSKPY